MFTESSLDVKKETKIYQLRTLIIRKLQEGQFFHIHIVYIQLIRSNKSNLIERNVPSYLLSRVERRRLVDESNPFIN